MTKAKSHTDADRERIVRLVRNSCRFARQRNLQLAANRYESQGDYLAMANVFEQITREMSDTRGFGHGPNFHPEAEARASS